MALVPQVPNPAEQSALTGDRISVGFFSTQDLLGGASANVPGGGGTFDTGPLFTAGYNGFRLHSTVTLPGASMTLALRIYDPDTETLEPAATNIAIQTFFASGTFVHNALPLLTGVVYPLWLVGFLFTNNNAAAATIDDFKMWLTRE